MIEITQQHINLVHRIIGTYFKVRTDNSIYADLCSIGCEGLLKARNIFDITQGTKFETLAYTIIIRDMLNFIRGNYSREFYVPKANVFSDEVDAEEVINYADLDMITVLIGEQKLEGAIEYISTLPEDTKGVLYGFLNGDNWKDTCAKYNLSKTKYYRLIDTTLEDVRQQCLVNQKP